MGKKLLTVVLAAGFLLAAISLATAAPKWLTGTTDEKLDKLADIQPGLGTIMMEYSYRMTTAYYAAKGGNWPLVGYQIKEAREIQEVGETTRPRFAAALKNFEKSYIDKLDATVKEKSFLKFEKAFGEMVNGCNECHAGMEFSFITYVLPKHPVAALKYTP